ncbi:MAG: carboxylating nicotinate-nucleotide diphosphorylase, partial [Candidatus Marinimicrobia bacterium]|nr:carboxylating nicotinate-nucleotide diphosphorylase [Candidatus Neomarinimicrobiota bacterium]
MKIVPENKIPSREQIDNLITIALDEDIGLGDITTRSIVSPDAIYVAEILTRENIVLCGLDILKSVFFKLDSDVSFSDDCCSDGDYIKSNTKILDIKANGVALLEGERVALNILQRLSGIATLTKQYAKRADPIQILDTRKTTPGLRLFEKYAVSCGGGKNHRFGLYDAVLIKDNHIKASGGIVQAVKKVKKNHNNSIQIEVETTTLTEVREAIEAKSDIIMLDNMSMDDIKEAVSI